MNSEDFKGFGFSSYRSIGDELVKICPIGKINFIIGQNNIGKSNIVNYLSQHYAYFLGRIKPKKTHFGGLDVIDCKFTDIDKSLNSKKDGMTIAFPILQSDVQGYVDGLIDVVSQDSNYDRRNLKIISAKENLIKLLNYFKDDNGTIWFLYSGGGAKAEFHPYFDVEKIKGLLSASEWRDLWQIIRRKSGGDIDAHWIPEVMDSIYYKPENTPTIEVIPAIRRVGDSGSEGEDYSGLGIIDRLAKLQNPSLFEQDRLLKFRGINDFLRNVLDNSSATINIPYERDTILVKIDNKTLPLSSLGTGIHEVIILASAATILENSVVCIEEPELHLHPLLQRKLVKYLSENTTNKYIFTTHSAHLLDAIDSEIFHVTQTDGVTKIESVESSQSRADICKDLGYKASDILQANCIIWVEGPSDRIYLNYWISSLNEDLIEGVHYSIMFYGGRLFSHLTALDSQDHQLDEFISVRRLNRNSVIMFDSDKSSSHKHLNATKKRLKSEFDGGPGFAWITKGREVENYLNPDLIRDCITNVHPSAILTDNEGVFDNLLNYKNKSNEMVTANKVKVAKMYTEKFEPDLTRLDLNEMTQKLCAFIELCN